MRLPKSLYRSLLRVSRDMRRKPSSIYIQHTPNITHFQQWGYYDQESKRSEVLHEFNAAFLIPKNTLCLAGDDLEAAIKRKFRVQRTDATDIKEATDRAITALQNLFVLSKLGHITSVHESHAADGSLRVICTARYDISREDSPKFAYYYRIRIENIGSQSVKLLGRHWKFYDDTNAVCSEVPRYGLGVIGQYPELDPGQGFEYMSMALLPTEVLKCCVFVITMSREVPWKVN